MKLTYKTEDCVRYIIAVLIVLISGTAVYSVEQFSMLRKMTLVVLIGVLFYTFIKKNNFKKKKIVIFTMYVGVGFCLLILKSPGELFGIITKMLMVILLTNYCYGNNNTYKLFEIIYKIVIACSIMSLTFWIILYVLKINLPYFYIEDGFYKSYFYLFFTYKGYIEQIGSFSFYRLQSIFWEPGVFAVYLLIALFFYSFLAKERNIKHFFILVSCLILTMSTTGLIVGIGLLAIHVLRKIKPTSMRMLVVIPMCLSTIPIITYLWMKKKNSAISPSYRLRMYDMTRSLKIWKENFFLGTGYNNTALFEIEGRTGNSNGFLNWCMTTGIVGLLVVIIPFIVNCIWSKSKERTMFIVYFGLFVLMNFTEPLIQTPIMILLISFSYAAMLKKRGFVYE